MKLFFIRHGQTDWNVEGRIQGSKDIELNETGIRQAEELGRKIVDSEYKFSKIYSSPKKRALKTAEILSNYTDIEYIPIEGLQEINFGNWEGISWEDVKSKYPDEYFEWHEKRGDTKPPNGESYFEMLDRVLIALHKIIDENTDNVAIVTHSAVIMCLQCYLTNTSFNKMLKFKTENASIVEVDSDLLMQLQ